MSEAQWTHRPPPELDVEMAAQWHGEPATPAELTGLRRQLRAALQNGSLPGGDDDDAERLLLAFEELASNGLRHGAPPVRVVVTATISGWLLEVSDAAVDRPPSPAIGRDAARGGLGLYLVAQLCATHGWAVRGDRKHVWCCILGASAEPVPTG